MDHTHNNVANPQAPSLVVVNKLTGRVAAVDGAGIGQRILHGQWSSPVLVSVAEGKLVLFGGGDSILYAFRPFSGPDDGALHTLDIAWQYDCCPADYRYQDGNPVPYARWNKNREDGPSEIIATPVEDAGRIYITIGQSPVHGPGQGVLSCIETQTGKLIWESRDVGRTLSDAAVHDGLVYVADYTGHLHCFDADTGQRYWYHDLAGGVWCATPVIANGKVYIANEKNRICVFAAGRVKKVIAEGRTRSVAITPVVSDDILFVPTQKRIFALRVP